MDAVAAIGQILIGARCPVVAGLSGDADAIRAAYRLALRAGASLESDGSDALYADIGPLAAQGAMATTSAEARARADVLLVVGERAAGSAALAGILGHPPLRAGNSGRHLVSIGQAVRSGERQHAIPVAPARLPATLALLRAVASGRLPAAGEANGLAEAAETIRQARFGVAVYDPGELGELGVDMLQGLVKDLNERQRFSSLSVGVESASRAALAVGAWMTGEPPRVGLGRGYPEHDPWRFDIARLAASGETDAILWLGVSGSLATPAGVKLSTAALLSRPEGGEADIVIEVAAAGESGAGSVFDERRGTFVHRKAAGRGGQPPASAVLDAIGDLLPQREA